MFFYYQYDNQKTTDKAIQKRSYYAIAHTARNIVYLTILTFVTLSQSIHAEVIVNKNVPVEQVTRQYLRSIFFMQTRNWPNGEPIQVFILPSDKAIHEQFIKNELKLFPYQLQKIWDRAVFSGSGRSPHVVTSTKEMLSRISKVPNSIGYISTDTANKEIKNNVKTLLIY